MVDGSYSYVLLHSGLPYKRPSCMEVLLATLLSTLNIPVTESFGLITAIDWLLDRFRRLLDLFFLALQAG